MVSSTFLENKGLQIKMLLFFFIVVQKEKKERKKKDKIWNLTCNLDFALPLSMLFSTKCMELKDIEGKEKKKSDRAKDQTYHGLAFQKP